MIAQAIHILCISSSQIVCSAMVIKIIENRILCCRTKRLQCKLYIDTHKNLNSIIDVAIVFSNSALAANCTYMSRHAEAACILKLKLSYVTDIILQNIKQNMQIEQHTICIAILGGTKHINGDVHQQVR